MWRGNWSLLDSRAGVILNGLPVFRGTEIGAEPESPHDPAWRATASHLVTTGVSRWIETGAATNLGREPDLPRIALMCEAGGCARPNRRTLTCVVTGAARKVEKHGGTGRKPGPIRQSANAAARTLGFALLDRFERLGTLVEPLATLEGHHLLRTFLGFAPGNCAPGCGTTSSPAGLSAWTAPGRRTRGAWLAAASCPAAGSGTRRRGRATWPGSGRIRRPRGPWWRRAGRRSTAARAASSRRGRGPPGRTPACRDARAGTRSIFSSKATRQLSARLKNSRSRAKSRPPTWSGYWLPTKQKSRPSSIRNCFSCSTRPRCKIGLGMARRKVEELDEVACP